MKNIFLNEKEDISKQATVGQDADGGTAPWASPICCQAEPPYYMLYNVVIIGGNGHMTLSHSTCNTQEDFH